MAQKIKAPMPPNLDLDSGFTLQWAALDPSSGAAVAGVKVSNTSLIVTQVTPGTPEDLQSGPFMLVPGPEN